MDQQKTHVFLVGAGPGAPDLLTLRAVSCLKKADVVLYDGLANQDILRLAPQAEWECVGKHGKLPFWTQEAINARIIELGNAGKCVVRLKGGDPAVFARTAEELQALCEAQLQFEVVPGITAGLAVASYVGIPLTHRDHASAVALVTGKQQDSCEAQSLDWQALARFPGTLVFYMGVTTAENWTRNLVAGGKLGSTPAAIVRRCTWKDQQVIRCRLDEVAAHLTPASKMRPPVVVVVGEVAALGVDWGWFEAAAQCQNNSTTSDCGTIDDNQGGSSLGETNLALTAGEAHSTGGSLPAGDFVSKESRAPNQSLSPDTTAPLAGCGVLLTRPEGQVREVASQLMQLGARVYYQPLLVVESALDITGFSGVAEQLSKGRLDGITFSSANSVNHFFSQLFQSGLDARCLGRVQIGCVGKATASELLHYGILADIVPDEKFGADALVDAIRSHAGQTLTGGSWLVTRTDASRPTLVEGLRKNGCQVEELLVYRARAVSELIPEIESHMAAGRIQLVTATSSQIAKAAFELVHSQSPEIGVVSLAEPISRQLDQLGWSPVSTAKERCSSALVDAIVDGWSKIAAAINVRD